MEIKFWKDKAKGTVDPKLFSEKAEEYAKRFSKENEEKGSVNKRTQIRKFYDEILHLDTMAQEESWDNIAPYVHMLIAKAAYAKGRKLVSDTFLAFMRNSISQINDEKELHIFANFFEAFMGFYKLYCKSN